METQPKLKAARFAKLEPGDLFIYSLDGASSFGLKVIDPNTDGDTFVLTLGPHYFPGMQPPFLMREPAATMVSFGKDFIFKFSEMPDGWSVHEPDKQFFCAALVEDAVFLRCNGNGHPGRYLDCWVNLSNGVMRWGSPPNGIVAFSVKWAILLSQVNQPPKIILEH